MRQPRGLKQQDTTLTPALEDKGRRGVIGAQGQGHPEKGGTVVGLETGMLPRVEKKGEKHPPLPLAPGPCQCLSLAESSWNLADVWDLGDATCRGHPTLQSREGQWRDLEPDRPSTGSGRNENAMTMFGLGRH